MVFNPVLVASHPEKPSWYQKLTKYTPNSRIAAWQLFSTLSLYFVIIALMIFTVKEGYPYSITLALAVVAAAVCVRIFILFHDCTHGCLVPSPQWNRYIGYICGILLTFTAFHDWRHSHAGHHITAGDLDRRGLGDITTLTVDEYLASSPWRRLSYRLYRSPAIMFTLGPGYYFLLRNRWPSKGAHMQDVHSVIFTNIAILAIGALAWWAIGIKTYILVQLPVLLIAATFGIWLFYVQHQFQGVYWARHDQWDPWKVAMEGAAFYQLPKMLQWLTGNIGFHHVHHARPGIPNYYLQKCYDEVPELQMVRPLTMLSSLGCLRLNLYDEKQHKMVSFGSLNRGGQSPSPDRVK